MTDLVDPWAQLLVGHQWPEAAAISAMALAASNRSLVAQQFDEYADLLDAIRTGPLGIQEGVTAEANRQTLQLGESAAREIADSNSAKLNAYSMAAQQVHELRSELGLIAHEGREAIAAVQSSLEPGSEKLSRIVQIVVDCQATANIAAAKHAGVVLAEIQAILDSAGSGSSSRVFANSSGFRDISSFASPDRSSVERTVQQLTGELTTPGNNAAIESATAGSSNSQDISGVQNRVVSSTSPEAQAQISSPADHHALNNAKTESAQVRSEGNYPAAVSAPERPPSLQAGIATPPEFNSSTTDTPEWIQHGDENYSSTAPQVVQLGKAGETALAITRDAAAAHPAVSGTDSSRLASTGFGDANLKPVEKPSAGILDGGPHAPNHVGPLPSSSSDAMATSTIALGHLTPAALNPHFLEQTDATAVPFEYAHSVGPPAETTPTTFNETAHPVITPAAPAITPALASPPAFATGSPITPQGPLIAYGADLKPSASLPLASPMAPAAPTSAPVTPASGTAPTGQPAVVRQQAAASLAAKASATERAFAATATGAAAGAAASRSAAESRLQRLLGAVARQQPRLCWAIGDLEDGSTVVATDIHNGWIPPHIDIPTGVRLLPPARRRNDLTGLLGSTTSAATYRPGEVLSPPAQPTPMSIRARDTKPIDDLGWELCQATKWRDGLPRLAHTLARAASSKTGYLESELELLREHLNIIECSVLDSYPETVGAESVGNWQLLATIDALINGETASANYHFAWFRAQGLTLKGPR